MTKTSKQPAGREQDRGPGARKVELERRLDANAELERRHAGKTADTKNTDGGAREAAEAERRRREAQATADDEKLDEALEDTFPASDPPALTTPTRTGG